MLCNLLEHTVLIVRATPQQSGWTVVTPTPASGSSSCTTHGAIHDDFGKPARYIELPDGASDATCTRL